MIIKIVIGADSKSKQWREQLIQDLTYYTQNYDRGGNVWVDDVLYPTKKASKEVKCTL